MQVDYVVDPGSVNKGNFHWVSGEASASVSNNIGTLAASMIRDLSEGKSVTLGMECALFMPCPNATKLLGAAREGECTLETGNKAFTASAGACATVTGVQALAWILREIQGACPHIKASTRWDDFTQGKAQLFVWEAFVSGSEKGANHHDDAVLALKALQASAHNMADATRVRAKNPINLAAMLMLWAGMTADLSMLHSPCVVLRPLPKSRPSAAA